MKEYRLGSSPAVNTPGVIAWAINGYAFEQDRFQILNLIKSIFPTLSTKAVEQLLSEEVPYTIEGETVVFSVEE